MSTNLPFEFIVDKEAKTVRMTRAFDAERSLVWDAFTKAELLDQWWAPKPFASRTKHMDFSVGGHRLYAMVSPEGQEHWGIQTYTSITPQSNFKQQSAFTDPDGNILPGMPTSIWDLSFSDDGAGTKVRIFITHETPESLEKIIAMGFQGGFTMTLKQLDSLMEGWA
jgi:uncharacterized protein YndB with AHSA1/START domain